MILQEDNNLHFFFEFWKFMRWYPIALNAYVDFLSSTYNDEVLHLPC